MSTTFKTRNQMATSVGYRFLITFSSILVIVLAVILFPSLKPSSIINMPPKPKLNVQSFPRPPLLEKTPRHLQVKYQSHTIADTKDGYWALETHHPPSKSFPSQSIFAGLQDPPLINRLPSILHPPHGIHPPPPPLPAHLLLRVERPRNILPPHPPQHY